MKVIDITGQRFGMLTVRAMLPGSKCLVDCDCGTIGLVTERYSVRKGLSRSCGCKQFGNHITHGESRKGSWTPEYRAWSGMIGRCHNPNATRFKDWGGRGISVFPEWRKSYEAFLLHVGRKPSPQHSLDRFPNSNGNYEPGNVRWATATQQARNCRSNRLVTAFGQTMTVADWSEQRGVKYSVLADRIRKGWNPERALTESVKELRHAA